MNGNLNTTMPVALDEGQLAMNFNPLGAPLAGVEDADVSDKYPSLIKGLVYVSGQLNLPATLFANRSFTGTVVCSTSVPNQTATFTYS